jgi:hypothetical protein
MLRIESGVHGVARAGVIEREGKLAPDRPSPTRAGVSSRKASSGRDDDGAGVFMVRYSAGTEASRNRIE